MEMADGDRFTPEQAEALSALRDGRNVFLSGNAGTGKSYVLNAFISDLKARNVDFLALAPTGIAALNLTDGSTIHRTLKIAPGVCAPDGRNGIGGKRNAYSSTASPAPHIAPWRTRRSIPSCASAV